MSEKNQEQLFNKKIIVTFFLSVLVVMIHINSFALYSIDTTTIGGALLNATRIILEGNITSVAIRLFFLISGVLFYRNYTYKNTLEKYKSRSKSLLVPYLIWCALYTIAIMVLHYSPMGAYFEFDVPFNIKNLVMGIVFNDYYQSFWFIFNLMIFTIACPLIYTLLKNKWVGFFVLVALTTLYAFNITIPEFVIINGEEYVAFWRADSIILYMLGAYIGLHFYDWFIGKKSKKFSIVCIVIAILMVVVQFTNEWTKIPAIINLLSLVIYSFSLWFAFDIFKFDKKPRRIFEYSFMMFALNFYLGLIVPQLVYFILPKSPFFALVNFILSSVIIIAIIVAVSCFLDKKLHKIYTIITGGR